MNAVIHFFSGTGNTARAVRILAARLAAAGCDVSLQSIEGRSAAPTAIPDLTVVAFPILSWAAPHFVLDYARRLPKAQGARAAVLASGGGFGAQGVGEMERVLRGRGYRVDCSGEAAYPDNWTMAVNPPRDNQLAEALAKGDAQVARFADNLLSEHPSMFACAFGHKLWSWPIARLFRSFGRRFLGKAFIADGQCTSCGLCAKMCPVQAIRMEGKPAIPRWNASCSACYRCINLCPVKSIQISVPRMVFHLGLNLVLTILCLGSIGSIHRNWVALPGAAGTGISLLVAVALLAVATMLQLTAVDSLLHGLASFAPLRRFFQWSYTKSFGRYRAPGFQPGKSGN